MKNILTPFNASPNPALLCVTPSVMAVLHKVRLTIDGRLGLTTILGDIGVGKSTVLRLLYSEYDSRDDAAAIFIATPKFRSDFAFMKSICQSLDVPIKKSYLDQERALQSALVYRFTQGQNIVVFVDEAQTLSGPMLETIRATLNFESNEGKLIQFVLSGQLEFREKLHDQSKKAFRKRIFLPSLLDSLSISETQQMLERRCEHAGIPYPFNEDALQRVYIATSGVPRDVLKVCASAFALAQLASSKEIGLDLIEAALDDFERTVEV